MFTFYRREYWGEYQILERYSTHYIEEHFGVDKDNVSIIKNDMLESGEQTCFDDYKNLLSFMANYDLSVEENYNYVCEQIDIKA